MTTLADGSSAPSGDRAVWSVGHSNHELAKFLALMQGSGMDVLADVRSSPFSRFAPHFDRDALAAAVRGIGLKYVFLGEELGGRPKGDEFYDTDGHVLYGEVATEEFFREGLDRLDRGVDRFRVVVMCAEEDPTHCHRRLLVTRVLAERGIEALHIRGDGRVQAERELTARETAQPSLLESAEITPWRSTQSVLRRRAQPSSSAF